jgi:hypothetical protein
MKGNVFGEQMKCSLEIIQDQQILHTEEDELQQEEQEKYIPYKNMQNISNSSGSKK